MARFSPSLALHTALVAVAPIVSVEVGKRSDSTTWVIHFDPSATVAQQTAANAVLAAFDMVAAQATSVSIPADANYKDLVSKLKGATPAQIQTYVTNNVTDLPSAKVLLAKILLILGTQL